MQDTLSAVESAELARLWCRPNGLTPQEMACVYGLVNRALRPCAPPELHALGESRDELVLQFIYLKVLRLQAEPPEDDAEHAPGARSNHSAPSSAYALCAYFRRYLIDCTRASAFRRKVSIDTDMTHEQWEVRQGSSDDGDDELAEHGLNEAGVLESARRFIDTLPEPDRVLLCESFGREAAGGLSGVAARHTIASYHYRAGRLGLVHRREALPADYAQTTIGQWIEKSLGIPIALENMTVILQVFKILAVQASCS